MFILEISNGVSRQNQEWILEYLSNKFVSSDLKGRLNKTNQYVITADGEINDEIKRQIIKEARGTGVTIYTK